MENNTDGASDENDEKMKNLDISEKEDNKVKGYTGRPKEF